MSHLITTVLLSLLLVAFDASAMAASCSRLELDPPVLSFRGREAHVFREIVRTVDERTEFRIDSNAVRNGFLECLRRAQQTDDRDHGLRWLDDLVVGEGTIGVRDHLVNVEARQRASLWKSARASVRSVLARGVAVDDRAIANRLLWHAWVEALLESLGNRHNSYIYADELDLERGVSRGRVFRIGFTVQTDDGQITVAEVQDDALRRHGEIVGSTLRSLDERPLDGYGYRDLIRYWYSPEPFDYRASLEIHGTTVDLSSSAIPFRMATLDWCRRDTVGYIRIQRFAVETVIELRRALRDLRRTQALIVDLRGNGGGRIRSEIIDAFLMPEQKLVTYRDHGANGDPSHVTGSVEYHGQRLAVLVDRDTASMSEIMAAAFVQHERATLFGDTTLGKGVSQHVFPIGDEGALHLVTRLYYFPGTDDTWDQVGIEPHVTVSISDEQRVAVRAILEAPVVDLGRQQEVDPVLQEALKWLEQVP